MPQQISTDETPLPMAPSSSAAVQKLPQCSHPTSVMTSLASPVSQKNTSLVITIVTTEQVPDVNNSATTTTIDRELKLRLTLPPCYDANQLKSLNVKLHQDYPSTHIPVSPASSCQPSHSCVSSPCSPSSVPSMHYKNEEATQHWQQQQRRLFREEPNHQVVPPPVLSSQDINAIRRAVSFDETSPRPETVSSSPPTTQDNRSNGKRRRRITGAATASTTQTSSRKKRKVTSNLSQ